MSITKNVQPKDIKHHIFAKALIYRLIQGCTALHCVMAIIVAVYIASVSFIEAKEK